jgi:two-component system, response regulator PdtaR
VSRSLRVLIVEDEYFVASYVADLMEEWGHEVMATCPTGEEAIQHLERGGVEIAILDIKLKGQLTGLDVAEVARAQGVPHLFLSGSGDPTTCSAARATDPLAFLQKPVSERQLSAILSEVAAECL